MAGAQQGIHNQPGFPEAGQVRPESRRLRHLHHLHPQAEEDVQVDPGIAGDLLPAGKQEDKDRDPGVGEIAGHHAAVAAIVAPAGQDRHRPVQVRKFPAQHQVGAPAGILHEHQGGDAHLFDGAAVQLPHLGGGDQFHGLWQFLRPEGKDRRPPPPTIPRRKVRFGTGSGSFGSVR
jgi:hypothetical protein